MGVVSPGLPRPSELTKYYFEQIGHYVPHCTDTPDFICAFKQQVLGSSEELPNTVAWTGSPLIFQFLDFLALGKSFKHMHIPLKVTASLRVKKALK